MSSRADSKTASQFVSLTLKLKDKFHPQRVRRCEQIKHSSMYKPPEVNLQSVCLLEDQEQAVVRSLQYFKALVDRLVGDKLALNPSAAGGLLGRASSSILEGVQTLAQLEPQLKDSQTVSSCLTHLYQSVAQLIRWTDQLMLQGNTQNNRESIAGVTTMIKAVLAGVKELVQLAAERKDGSPSSPVQSKAAMEQLEQHMSDRTSCLSPGSPAEEPMEQHILVAPPKPSLPPPEHLLWMALPHELSPPALPPKICQSSSSLASCRVAMVAPMGQEPEDDRLVDQEDACLKPYFSSRDSADDNTHSEGDPNYNFLHIDLSSHDLPPLPHPSTLAPPLPEKRRHRAAVSDSSSFEVDHNDPTQCNNVTGPDESLSSSSCPRNSPPPLPEKKRHIHQYLRFCSSYDAESAAFFYKPPLASHQQHNSRHTQLDTPTPGSTASPEFAPVPILPLKRKQQQHSVYTFSQYEDKHTKDSSQNIQQETEEVLLTCQQEILHRITMKSTEKEEDSDIKAASPDILLVCATESDGSMSHLAHGVFREVFLSTYRTFITSNDVIFKLQHRYRHLTERPEAAERTAADKTFQLLLTVVDELCVTELDSDLLLLLMNLVFNLLSVGQLGPAHRLRVNILSKMEQRWHLISSPHSLRPLAARGVAARPGTLLDFRSQDLAEQLTLLDSELFYKIQVPEVLLWSKEQNEEMSPNLTRFTEHFNSVSFWVRSVIIVQEKPQDREKLLLKFMKVLRHLRKLNNFNSYLSILSALDSAPLRRLDWQKNTTETLEDFSSLIDSSSSFRAYRAALAEVEPPCIPYLGLILQDLTFIHLGNPDTLSTSHGSNVNFSKCWQQFNILESLRSYQRVRYSLQTNDDILSFFNYFSDHLAEEALWELSLRLRPRNAPHVIQR